jgi:hypothetical protein
MQEVRESPSFTPTSRRSPTSTCRSRRSTAWKLSGSQAPMPTASTARPLSGNASPASSGCWHPHSRRTSSTPRSSNGPWLTARTSSSGCGRSPSVVLRYERRQEHGLSNVILVPTAASLRARTFEADATYLHGADRLILFTFEPQLFEHVRSGAFGREILAARTPTSIPAHPATDVVTIAGRRAASWLPSNILLAIRPTSMA